MAQVTQTVQLSLSAVAALVQLTLGVVSLLLGSRRELATVFALLTLDLFAWSMADVLGSITEGRAWGSVDRAAASMAMAFALHFVLILVGQRRNLRWWLVAVYGYCMALATLSVMGAFSDAAYGFVTSGLWTIAQLGALAVGTAVGVVSLSRFLGRSLVLDEIVSGRVVLLALAAAVLLAATDLQPGPGLHVNGSIGAMVGTLLLAVVTFRYRLLGRQFTPVEGVQGVAIALVAVSAYLLLVRKLQDRTAALVFGVVVLTTGLIALVLRWTRSFAGTQERLRYNANLGRMSEQMAHDVRNPVAAIKGAAQYLQREVEGDAGAFVDLIVEQTDRLTSVLQRYERLGKLEPRPERIAMRSFLERVLRPFLLTPSEGVRLTLTVAPQVDVWAVDPDLLAVVVENLVRNALEAMPTGGDIRVEVTEKDNQMVLALVDTGNGMAPTDVERAFDDFFTTKARGSGLGLSFARRVAEAHGGSAELESQRGAGTEVRLRLPKGYFSA